MARPGLANDHGGFRVSDAEIVGDQVWIVVAAEDGATSVRRGTVGAGGITWGDAPSGIGGAGRHVDRISSGPEGMLAVGWDEGPPCRPSHGARTTGRAGSACPPEPTH